MNEICKEKTAKSACRNKKELIKTKIKTKKVDEREYPTNRPEYTLVFV